MALLECMDTIAAWHSDSSLYFHAQYIPAVFAWDGAAGTPALKSLCSLITSLGHAFLVKPMGDQGDVRLYVWSTTQ